MRVLLLALLCPPAAAVVLESQTYPIRVEAEDEALAAEALAMSEDLWASQIDGMGFAVPLMVDEDEAVVEGFDLLLSSMGQGSLATFDVLGDHPLTPAADCPVRSEVNSDYMGQPGWLGMCVSHLLNHASLHAVDCLEPQMPSFDTFSVAVEVLDGQAAFWDTYIEQYQAMPYESVDMWFRSAPKAYYQFGSSLFALFLDDHYGQGDGALLAELWRHTAQDGTVTGSNGELAYGDVDNEPDYLDAIDIGLAEHGASMDEAWVAFTASRWFVGANDDGAHMRDAGAWTSGVPLVDSSFTEADLPLVDQPIVEAMAEYSSSFVRIDLQPQPGLDLLVEIEGAGGIAWGGTALALQAEGPAVEIPLLMEDGSHGSARVPLEEGIEAVVLAIAALSDGQHDPEDGDVYRDYSYGFSASVVDPLPGADTGDGGDVEPTGCACSSAHTRGALPPMLGLLGLLGLALSRRRGR
jgi:MYXO-CTERM domain-containing protein